MRLQQVITVVLCVGMFSVPVRAGEHRQAVQKGNEAYRSGKYKEALEQYHVAETELPESPEIDYNIAGALFQQGGFEEAMDKYTKALATQDAALAAKAHYNLGSTHFRAGDFPKAIEEYQKSLEMNPDDIDAKFNLELARQRLKEQTKPENQEQENQDQQQQQEQQQQEQDQEQQDQEQQEGNQPQESEENQDDKKDQKQQPQPQAGEQEMSREDAERILNALRDDEQDIQKNVKRHKAVGSYLGKDW